MQTATFFGFDEIAHVQLRRPQVRIVIGFETMFFVVVCYC